MYICACQQGWRVAARWDDHLPRKPHRSRAEDARALAGFIPDCLILVRRLLRDRRVPRRSKLLLGALAGYLVLPIDLVPDVIPVAGQLDDAIIAAYVLRSVLRASTGPARRHR
jgi:uncharacterized membrane protein YkvA (DUF1232 family)